MTSDAEDTSEKDWYKVSIGLSAAFIAKK